MEQGEVRGFLKEWEEDEYYGAAALEPGVEQAGVEQADVEPDVEEHGGHNNGETHDVANDVDSSNIIHHGARLLISIGAPPSWHGLTLFNCEDGEYSGMTMFYAAYDDGDLKRMELSDLKANEDMNMLVRADPESGGVVANEKELPQAIRLTWYKKARGEPVAIGVLLGNPESTDALAGEPILVAHVADTEVLKKLEENTARRGRRSSTPGMMERMAFYTFRRGDVIKHSACEPDDPDANLCVYGIIFKSRDEGSGAEQGRKMLVIYDIDIGIFFVGKWTDYVRVPKYRGAEVDLNDNEKVEVVSANVFTATSMASAFISNTELQSIKSWKYAVKLAETSTPPSAKVYRAEKKKEEQAQARLFAAEKKKADRLKQKKERADQRAAELEHNNTKKKGVDQGSDAEETQHCDDFPAEEEVEVQPIFQESTGLQRPQRPKLPPMSFNTNTNSQSYGNQLRDEQREPARDGLAGRLDSPPPPPPQTMVGHTTLYLPAGWKRAVDPSTRREYFYNKSLGCSQFEPPSSASSPPLPPPAPRQHPTLAEPTPVPQALGPATVGTHSTALTVTPMVENGRGSQMARLRAMLPYLEGDRKAYTAGEIAVLELQERY